MSIKNILKIISYNPIAVKISRFFNLRPILRKIYYLLFCPKDNILKVNVSGVGAKFYVKSPDELRLAESITGDKGEKKILESLILLLKKGDVVYDVGANVGIYTVLLSKTVGEEGKIIAFEPEPESANRLKENLRLNNLNNVFLSDKALGQGHSSAKLYIGKTTGNFSLVNLYEKERKFKTVEIVKGDDFVREKNLPIPKAVKIDVEGYEYSVLSGLRGALVNPGCRAICCEIHVGLFEQGITEEKIFALIKSLGFKKIDIFKRAFSAYHIIATKE